MTQRQTFDVSGMTCAAWLRSRREDDFGCCRCRARCGEPVEKLDGGGIRRAIPPRSAAISAAVEKAGYGAAPRIEAAAAAGRSERRSSLGRAGKRRRKGGGARAHAAHRVVCVYHPLVLLIHGPHVRLAPARVLPGSREHAYVRVYPVPALVTRDFRELQVLPRGLQDALPRLAEHGLAHRAGLDCLDGLRHRGDLPHRVGDGPRRHRFRAHGRDGFVLRVGGDDPHADHAGKYFEARAKGKTTDAIAQLMDLSPKTAIRRNIDGAEEEVPVDQVRRGISSSFAPVRACLSTEWWSKARARSTSPSSRAKAYRWKRAWELQLRVRR